MTDSIYERSFDKVPIPSKNYVFQRDLDENGLYSYG